MAEVMGSELGLSAGMGNPSPSLGFMGRTIKHVLITALSPLVFSTGLGVVGEVSTNRSSPPETKASSEASQFRMTTKLEHLERVPSWAKR